ncbi:MAG: endonuclease/exonuclease/phosphatase family protein [Limnochordales bacterium]|nr:endonuclease/exonuclease/phosphatase family protein [Limnochordales bacterium]
MHKVRVMTWNIHEGIGEDGLYDLGRVERAIRLTDPDLVALQEVGRCWSAASRFEDQLLLLALRLNFHPFFAPIVKQGAQEQRQYGCGLLSRWPWKSVEDHGLTRIGTFDPEKRVRHLPGFPHGTVMRGEVRLHFFGTHLYWRDAGIRRREAEEMLAIIEPLARRGEPVILAGDMNAEVGDTELEPLVRSDLLYDAGPPGLTYPARSPRRRIDLVFVTRGVRVSNALVINDEVASDHRPVIVDLELPGVG